MRSGNSNQCKIGESDDALPMETIETDIDEKVENEKSTPAANLADPVNFVSIFKEILEHHILLKNSIKN